MLFFFFNDTATTEIYTLSLHDALPIFGVTLPHEHTQIALWHIQNRWDYWELARDAPLIRDELGLFVAAGGRSIVDLTLPRSEEHTSELQSRQYLVCRLLLEKKKNNTNI